MADNVVPAVNAQRLALQGLPLRLIQDGLLDEKSMQTAMAAAKEANTNLVSHLVANNLANAREIAIAASQEFGVPLMDLGGTICLMGSREQRSLQSHGRQQDDDSRSSTRHLGLPSDDGSHRVVDEEQDVHTTVTILGTNVDRPEP